MNEQVTNEALHTSPFEVSVFLTEHVVPDMAIYEEIKDEQRQQMAQLFDRNADNIYWHEEASGFHRKNRWLTDKGFRQYGSFKQAMAYGALFLRNGTEPTDEAVNEYISSKTNDLVTQRDGDGVWDWMQYELLDEFLEKGYRIQVVEENPPIDISHFPDKSDTFLGFVETYKTRAWITQKRDEAIAKQIIDMREKKVDERTRVFVAVGFHHKKFIDMLPPQIKGEIKTYVAKRRFPKDPRYSLLEEKLVEGIEISEDEWAAAYMGLIEMDRVVEENNLLG